MPLPVAHSLAGYSLYAAQRLPFFRKTWQTVLFFVVLANLPDLDFVPGFFVGDPNFYHSTFTHTLGAAAIVGILGGWFFSRRHGRFWAYALIIGATYYSHVLLDHFNQDGRPPYGVMLFWPLSSEYYMSPVAFFSPVQKSSVASQFVASVLSAHNFWVAAKELILLGPLAVLAYIARRRRLAAQR